LSFQIFSSIEESHTYVDKSLLPKEYGGDMEMSIMIGEFIFNTQLNNQYFIRLNNDNRFMETRDVKKSRTNS